MKRQSRSVAVLVLTVILSLQLAPVALAAPRDREDFPAKIVRVIQKLQRFFGLVPFDTSVTPPTP